jgi:hypothetical protein
LRRGKFTAPEKCPACMGGDLRGKSVASTGAVHGSGCGVQEKPNTAGYSGVAVDWSAMESGEI